MKNIISLILIYLVCIACGYGCASETAVPLEAHPTKPEIQLTPSTSTQVVSNMVSNIIAKIYQSPLDFIDEPIEIVGYFHGWDLLNEMETSPPVTRSDWVIADDSGAIYVTGKLPQNFDPSSQDQVGLVIRLAAIVVKNQENVYLEAQSIEVIPEK